MNSDIIEAVRTQLSNAQDNLHRARSSFRGQDLEAPYGESGATKGEIIAEYEAEVARWKKAFEEASK